MTGKETPRKNPRIGLIIPNLRTAVQYPLVATLLGEVITREEALDAGLKKYRTGESCQHDHNVERWTDTGECIECARILSDKRKDGINNGLKMLRETLEQYKRGS